MNQHYEQIELYLSGALNGDELDAFEKSMASDPALSAAVKNHDIAQLIFDGLEEQDIREEINNIKKSESKSRLKFWWIGIAAGVLILLGLIYWMSSQNKNVDVLYAEYLNEKPAVLAGVRSGTTDRPKNPNLEKFREAYSSMKEGNAGYALSNLNDLVEIGFDDAIFYRSLCYMYLGNIARAKEEAELAIKKGDNRAIKLLSDLNSLE